MYNTDMLKGRFTDFTWWVQGCPQHPIFLGIRFIISIPVSAKVDYVDPKLYLVKFTKTQAFRGNTVGFMGVPKMSGMLQASLTLKNNFWPKMYLI